ncbi:MAG: TlpA disulfide reductase family protein [Bacteroidales bacterium]|nr:TlpA disulfide reductase family protein [Bacteroidales bacterium]MDD4592897.1 TlpA disulfide reductase family protein [Parabacteroides sp.]
MKKLMGVLLLIMIVVSCNNPSKNNSGFTLNVSTGDSLSGKVYLQMYEAKEYTTVDSADMVGGKISFSGKVIQPMVYALQNASSTQRALIFLDNSKMNVTLNGDWEVESLDGSNDANLFMKYRPQSVEGTLNTDSLISTNRTSAVPVYFLTREVYNYDYDGLKAIRNKIDSSLIDHPYVKDIDGTLADLERMQPGKEAPDFTLKTINGDSLTLSSLRGKYVLVDFWASWCPDCRKSNPELVKLYNSYKNKNFTIVGVSIDEDETNWKMAVEKDGLIWQQTIGNAGWKSEVAQQYGVKWIPTAMLIDPQGVIVTRSVELSDIEGKLKEIFN